MAVDEVGGSRISQDIMNFVGFWHLQFQAVSPLIRNVRGLSQGLAKSVLMTEAMMLACWTLSVSWMQAEILSET